MISFLWFMAGVVVCRFFFFFGIFTNGSKIIKTTELECLRLFMLIREEYEHSSKIRHAYLEGYVDSEQAKILKNMEEHNIRTWQERVIKEFVTAYPKQYKWLLTYHNWSGAMEHLQAHLIQDKSKK